MTIILFFEFFLQTVEPLWVRQRSLGLGFLEREGSGLNFCSFALFNHRIFIAT